MLREMLRKRSWPAVSQIEILTWRFSIITSFVWNSTPNVSGTSFKNSCEMYLERTHLLPTPLSPTITHFNGSERSIPFFFFLFFLQFFGKQFFLLKLEKIVKK